MHLWVRLCVHACVCGSKAKWSGHQPANRKVAGLIPAQDTLVLLLFPKARNFTCIGPVYPVDLVSTWEASS